MLERYQRVYAAVDLSAVHWNMERMYEKLSPETKMIGVIKTDGYGHGAVSIGRELETLPYVFGYATATAEEAMKNWSNRRSVPLFSEGICWRNWMPVPGSLGKRH